METFQLTKRIGLYCTVLHPVVHRYRTLPQKNDPPSILTRPCAGLMLVHRLQRWRNIKPAQSSETLDIVVCKMGQRRRQSTNIEVT